MREIFPEPNGNLPVDKYVPCGKLRSMKLETYLSEKKIKPAAFAASINVAPSTITRIIRGERTPRIDLIAKIKVATKGKVKAEDFMEVA